MKDKEEHQIVGIMPSLDVKLQVNGSKLEVLCWKSKRFFGNIVLNSYIWGYEKTN